MKLREKIEECRSKIEANEAKRAVEQLFDNAVAAKFQEVTNVCQQQWRTYQSQCQAGAKAYKIDAEAT